LLASYIAKCDKSERSELHAKVASLLSRAW
jgi:hypothetical protein